MNKKTQPKKQTLKNIAQILFAGVTLALFLLQIDLSSLQSQATEQDFFEGKIIEVTEQNLSPGSGDTQNTHQNLSIEITSGENAGDTIMLQNPLNEFSTHYSEGDQISLSEYQDILGESQISLIDHLRHPALFWLTALFIALVLLINRKKGLLALLSLAFSFLVLFKLMLPLLLLGKDPVLIALLGSLFILPVMFYFSHGFNKKTHIAIIGTLLTLLLTSLLAGLFTELTHLSGLATEESAFLKTGVGSQINFKGLLLAGILISLLGVLDDVNITQSSIIERLKKAQPKLKFTELYKHGMIVGRDHIASVINTLILVYTGASLPLLLLLMDASQPIEHILNLEFMAEEILRTLIGSIGLVLAVPITTLLAAWTFSKE